ncbi:MAG: hypothetical protein J7647_18630 [Cyanobacteria bacterium SBLK]|nr:hypothetical protein [Cyanobacteria bacterium SBLK]
MNTYVNYVLSQYRSQGIIIDSNIFILWVVGTVNPKRISQFKRTKIFFPEDYTLLLKFMSEFSSFITMPSILTEVNGFINQIAEPEKTLALNVLAQIINRLTEIYIKSQQISQVQSCNKFGLTDCGILEACLNRYLVLTNDLRFLDYLKKQSIDAINFQDLREWDSK